GKLTIGFTTTATYTVLPELIRHFKAGYPQVEVEMLELSTEAQVTAINNKEIDLGFLHPPIDDRGLELYPLLAEEFVAVLPRNHPLTAIESLSLIDLKPESLILHPRVEGPFLYDEFLKLCHQAGFKPEIVQEVNSHQSRICLVAAGIGITFIPKGLQKAIAQDLVCKPIQDSSMQLEFAVAWRSLDIPPVLQKFVAMFQDIDLSVRKDYF
ncbi:MAG: LysR family substrate-binding domain-containing protein, partial [Cyanobacteria bacterium J06600_6]